MDTHESVFGPVVFAYTRAQAIEDGLLVDVSKVATEAGFKWPAALTRTVYDRYVEVPEALAGCQDVRGRLWDIMWMCWVAIRTGRITGDTGEFGLLVRFPEGAEWQSNEKRHSEGEGFRLVTLKAVCGPGDDAEPCISIMLPTED